MIARMEADMSSVERILHYTDKIEFEASSGRRVFMYTALHWHQESLIHRVMKRCLLRKPYPP